MGALVRPRTERSGAAGGDNGDRASASGRADDDPVVVPVSAAECGSGAENGTGADSGSVTVEAAVGLTAIVLVLAMCLAGIGCLITALRVTDAAGQAARLAARGDSAGARAAVTALAPAGSVLTLRSDGDTLTARVVAGPLGGLLPGIHVAALAVSAIEEGADVGAGGP